jgi:hypothetical protein
MGANTGVGSNLLVIESYLGGCEHRFPDMIEMGVGLELAVTKK